MPGIAAWGACIPRLRVARDIHDSLLQSAAGSALQLLAARRLLDRDPDEARRRLEDVQAQQVHGWRASAWKSGTRRRATRLWQWRRGESTGE